MWALQSTNAALTGVGTAVKFTILMTHLLKLPARVQGTHGDIASSLSGLVTGVPSWLPHGTLEYLHTPGHSPGHLVFIHLPSKSVIAGDAFSYQSRWWPFARSSTPHLARPYPIATINSTAVQVCDFSTCNSMTTSVRGCVLSYLRLPCAYNKTMLPAADLKLHEAISSCIKLYLRHCVTEPACCHAGVAKTYRRAAWPCDGVPIA